jgi:ubiquinone biosynthesis protein COQ4
MSTKPFERTPLPPRRMQWLRAARALARFSRENYDSVAIQEFAAALDGGDGERSFQSFLATADAPRLLADLPDLAGMLDDHERLAALPPGSLGRAFLELAKRDGIRVRDLTEGARLLPDDGSLHPDEARRWFGDRGIAAHDLLHILTGYERDHPGESLLIAFSLPRSPFRIFRIALILSLFATPKRQWLGFVRDLRRAYLRGREAAVSTDVAWEKLLPLPIDEARRRLRIAPLGNAHPYGLWRPRTDRGGWERIALVAT